MKFVFLLFWTLIFCLPAALSESSAVGKNSSCADGAIRKQRRDFQKLFDRKSYVEAAALLKKTHDVCHDVVSDDDLSLVNQFCWSVSDRSLALYKAGELFACRKLLGAFLNPFELCSRAAGSSSAVVRALKTNFDLCQGAIDAALVTPECPLKTPEKTIASVAILDSVNLKSCLALVNLRGDVPSGSSSEKIVGSGQSQQPEAQELSRPCAKIVFLKAQSAQDIASPEILLEPDFCCQLTRLAWLKQGEINRLYLYGSNVPAHSCSGAGSMRAAPSAVLKWHEEKLEQIQDTSWTN